MVAPQGRLKGDVHQDPARVQEPSRRGELAPFHRPVSRAAQRAPVCHVRDIDVNTALW